MASAELKSVTYEYCGNYRVYSPDGKERICLQGLFPDGKERTLGKQMSITRWQSDIIDKAYLSFS